MKPQASSPAWRPVETRHVVGCDKRFRSTAAGGPPSAGLVGTAKAVTDALLRYHDLGVSSFLISGYDMVPDLEESAPR